MLRRELPQGHKITLFGVAAFDEIYTLRISLREFKLTHLYLLMDTSVSKPTMC